MAQYEVVLKDGSRAYVEAPPGATPQQLAAAYNQQMVSRQQVEDRGLIEARRAKEESEARLAAAREARRRADTGFLENALTGFGSGAVGIGELSATGSAALLDEENELAARDRIQSLAKSLRPEGGDPESVTYKLFSGLGSIAGLAAPALAAAAAAPAAAAGAVGLGTATALGMSAGAGEARERARAAGLTGEALTGPTVGGTLIGSLEGLPVARPLAALGRALRIPGLASIGERLATKIDAETVAGRLAQRGKSAGITGTAESAQEGAAAILQNLVEQGYNPARELVDAGVIEESLIGGGAGAIFQGLVDFLVRGRPRGATPETEDRGESGEQLEMFPGEDLGTRPQKDTEPESIESQLEMFTQEEMGRPPERPDERQLDLFGRQEPDLTDRRLERAQGVLQFAPDAPAGRRFTEEETPISPAMSEAMAPIARELEFQRAEAERAARLEAEKEADMDRLAAIAAAERQLEIAAQGAEVPVRTLDGAFFDELGIPKGAGVRKKYKGRTTDDAEVLEALRSYAQNPNTNSERRAKVLRFLAGEEVAPSEPTTAVPEPDAEPGAGVAGVEPSAVGAGPADGRPVPAVGRGRGEGNVGAGPEGGPAVSKAPEPGSVEGAGVPAAEPVDGEGVQPSPLELTPDTVIDEAVMDALGIPKEMNIVRGLLNGQKLGAPNVAQLLQTYIESGAKAANVFPETKKRKDAVASALQRIKGITTPPPAAPSLEGQGELFPGADLGTAPARPAEPEAGIEEGPSPQQQLFDTAGQPIVPPAAPESTAEPTPEAPEAEAKAGPTNVPRWKQVLGEPPKWATLVGEDYVGDVVYVNGDIGLFRAYDKTYGTYSYFPIKKDGDGVRFRPVDHGENPYATTFLTDAEAEGLNYARMEIEFEEEVKQSQNPNGPFAEGEQLAFSTNFPKDLAQIATQWAQLLGIKDRVFFATREDLQSLEEIEKRNLYGSFGGPVRSLGHKPDRVKGSTRELADASGARLGHALFIQVRKNKTATLETLAHEMGHILEVEAFNSAPEETRQAIMGEYEQWLATKGEKNAATWVRELRAHMGGRLEVRQDPTLKDATVADLSPQEYWTSFSEYFADQVSKWAVSSERPITVVEQFFARLAAALRRLYASLAGKASLPNAEMKKYLDSRMPSESPLTAVGLPLAPPTDTAKTETVKKAPTAPVSAEPKAPAAKPAPKKTEPKPAPKKAAPKAEPKATVSKTEAPASRKFATQFPTDPTPRDDVRKAAILANSAVKRRPKTSREGEPQSIIQGTAAKAYFSNYARVIDAISAMAYEVAFKSDGMFPGTGASLRGKGKDAKSNAQLAMEWVNNNLSQPTRDLLAQQVNYYVKAAAKMEQLAAQDAVAEGRKLSAAQKRKIREYEKQLAEETNRAAEEKRREVTDEFNALQAVQKIMDMRLDESAVAGLDVPLHPAVERALSKGDLLGAIQGLAKSHPLQRFRSLANKLASRLGNTKLQLVTNLKDAAGNPAAGLFDPKTNTIKLDRDTGLNTHALMHETAHAVTSANLANKGHPTTQALNKLFNDIKDSLDTAYGAQSLDEFVAEAFSNPEFQAKLHTINLKGDPVSAWQRFVGAVANFLRSLVGLDTKPATAQDQFFRLVDNILAPSPETRNAGALYMASQSGEGGQVLSAAYENAPTWGKQAVESLGDFLSRVDVAEKAKRFILDLTPLNNFADLVKDSLPEAKQLDDIVYKQSAMLAKMLEKTEPTVAKVAKWFKEQGKQTITVDGIQMDKGTALNDAAHVGSYEGVNPTYDESRYKGTEKLEAYRYVKRRYDKLGPEGQAAYRNLLNTYKFFKDQIGESLEIALEGATPDSKSRTALIKDLYDRLINEGGIDPYVAFDREGKFWLEYNAIDPRTKQPEYFIEAFDTKAARERAVKALEAKKGEIGLTGLNRFTNIAETDYNNAPPGSFVREILDILEANNVDQETKDSVMRTFLEYLPEKSMAQAFQFRKGPGGKGVRGMRGDITPLSVNMPRHDVVDVLQKRVPALARQISQLRYNREIQGIVSDAEARVKAKGRPDADVRNLEQLKSRAKFVQNPNIANWSKRITSSIFAWTLGANPSSALLQFSQIGLVVAPMLAARPGVGLSKTTAALGNAVRAFMASGTSRKVEMVGPDGDVVERTKAMPSIDNFDFDGPKPKHMSEEYWKKLRVLARVGADHNVLGRSIIQDMVDIEDSRGLAAKLNTAMAFMFHNAEKMNKQVALMMAYEVELAGNKNPTEAQMERAALNAIEFVEIANGSAAQAGAAPIAQNDIGRIAYMYKRYGVSMVYLQLKMLRDAFKGQDPEVRNLAKRQLVATWGAAGLLSGAMGMPFYGVISMVYDAFREDDEDDFDAVMQKSFPPLIARGALNYLTGVDVASRVQMTDLLFREPIIENESFLWEMVMTFGGPAVGLANNFERGVEQILEGNTERGIESMAPAAMRNVMRSIRYYTEGAETLRGDPVIDDVGFGHAALQALGFAPAEYIRKMEINQNAKRIDRSISDKRSKLHKKYYIALRQGDGGEVQDIMTEIRRFNIRNPEYPITPESIRRSLAGHIRTSQRMHYGVTYSPKLQQRLLNSINDYEGAVSIWD